MTSSAEAGVWLRATDISDSGRLLAWRNDTDAVRFSGTRRQVTTHEHDRWLQARLAPARSGMWIGEVDGRPVGQIRVDRIDAGYEVHIAVAPTARGRGYGKGLVRALQARAAGDGLTPLFARVDPANSVSMKTFAGCGFVEQGTSNRLVVLRWCP